ncbi:unnamed protein product [Brugia pahangi]|uniref:CPG4 domain-containing protein n=1 Tax=Brugia pahangi TaxID=6280 RepID=A0A0N4TRV0_BRUPA|nr:unnamed protein product [Brugia pahangi]
MYIHNVALFLLIFPATQQGVNGGNKDSLEASDLEKYSTNDLARMLEFDQNCAEGCLKPFLLTLRANFVSGNNYERLVNTCEKLSEVYECMDRIKKCQPNYLFRIFMDGFEYMCIEHPADCEQKCKAHKLMAGWFIYSIMQSTTLLHTEENGAPPRVNIGFLRKITSEACSIVQCYFLCLKTKYNARCHGIGGNLLMLGNINELGKSLFREQIKRSDEETIVKTLITLKKGNETNDIGRDNIGWQDSRDYVENCSAEYDKDCSDSKQRHEIRETDNNFSS